MPKEEPKKKVEPWFDLSTNAKSESEYDIRGPQDEPTYPVRAIDGKALTPFEKLNTSF